MTPDEKNPECYFSLQEHTEYIGYYLWEEDDQYYVTQMEKKYIRVSGYIFHKFTVMINPPTKSEYPLLEFLTLISHKDQIGLIIVYAQYNSQNLFSTISYYLQNGHLP